ncbi:hypothetical protein SAMN05443429_10325 [Cruoricaptor ignavus]|uniref:Outer membrane protein assembly factor BamA n=2 Tax=Cruoricaptor ignavus TaxID=1118202 RepID=A0A1M6CW01_9FLAO|nr:hypothetical protein SAMN05443429_10325 [Cruoricaptor ignavus]
MKAFAARLFLLIFPLVCSLSFAQNFILKDIETGKEFVRKDSMSAVKFLDSLVSANYFLTKIVVAEKYGSDVRIIFEKGKNFNQARLEFSPELSNYKRITSTKNLDSLQKSISRDLYNSGYPFNRVLTQWIGFKQGQATVRLSADLGELRQINSVEIRGYDKVPRAFVKNINRRYAGKPYSQKLIQNLNTEISQNQFIALERQAQTQFTKDSTKIYLFLQKKKASSFDGIIGFGTDERGKFKFNGLLDLQFINLLNSFEDISLHWQRSQDGGQNLSLQVDVPFLFKSRTGANIDMNIFVQDSAFAKVRFLPSLYRQINQRNKIGLNALFETSAVLEGGSYANFENYNSNGVGIWYSFTKNSEIPIFLYDTELRTGVNIAKLKYNDSGHRTTQTKFEAGYGQNIKIFKQNWINISAEAAGITPGSSNKTADNTMLRFGGWKSMRSFGEQSILANFYAFGGLKYRYLVNDGIYFDLFGQYGFLENKNLKKNPNLYSFGAGFTMQFKLGIMTFQLSNGGLSGTPLKFDDTKIHWGLLTKF